MSTSASSSDPRDKIFGVLSLLEPQLREFLPVDYSLDHVEVFGLAIMICIAECESLKILKYASLPDVSDYSNASTFGMKEFLWFLHNTRLPPHADFSYPYPRSTSFSLAKETQKPWRPTVSIKMISRLTHSLENVNSPDHGQHWPSSR